MSKNILIRADPNKNKKVKIFKTKVSYYRYLLDHCQTLRMKIIYIYIIGLYIPINIILHKIKALFKPQR